MGRRKKSTIVSLTAEEALEQIQAEVNKEVGYDAVAYRTDFLSNTTARIPFGCDVLDGILYGGLAVGRIVEMFGWESAGKSTLIDHLLISTQRLGGIGIKLDQEVSHSEDRFVRMGGDPARLLVQTPEHIEDAIVAFYATVEKIAKQKEAGVFPAEMPITLAWDTLHSAPAADLVTGIKEGNYFTGGVSKKARVLQEMFRTITTWLPHNHVTLVIANQMIASLNPYGQSSTTSGGNALKFYPSTRLSVKRVNAYNEGEQQVGIITEVTVIKNKVDPPLGVCRFPITFEYGIDNEVANFWKLRETGMIHKPERSGWHTLLYGDRDPIKFFERDFKSAMQDAFGDEWRNVISRMAAGLGEWIPSEDDENLFRYRDTEAIESAIPIAE